MSVIEGIGDEILQCGGLLIVALLGFIAWWSTGIRERPQIRTVLILEHRSPNEASSTASNAGGGGEPTRNVKAESGACSSTPDGGEPDTNQPSVSGSSSEPSPSTTNTKQETSAQESNDESQLRRRNLTKSSEETRSDDGPSSSSKDTSPKSETEDNMRIRIKYLNDDLKLVDGRPQELLGDFKRRHFSVEIAADKLVRLIFNGQVLQRDNETLKGYGLYDNCVVHCLILAQRTPPTGGANRSNSSQQQSSSSSPIIPTPEWNLGTVLCSSLALILILAWYFRYQSPQLFSITTTSALVCLTGIFMLCILSMFMTENESIPAT